MNTQIKLQTPKLPKALADLIHSNQFLKMFSIFSVGVSALSLFVNLLTVTRPPVVLALTQSAEPFALAPPPNPEDEIKIAVSRYIELRYRWDPSTVKDRLKAAEAFISNSTLQAYRKSVADISRFSTEKQVSQRVYSDPKLTRVSLDQKTVSVYGDRITVLHSLKAAGELKLELSFESGLRTKENPWGIYINKEKEN